MSHGEVDCSSSAVMPASIVSGASVSRPHWSTPALWDSREYFLDCLVAALEVRRTTEDDGITACFLSPQAFKHQEYGLGDECSHGIAWSPYIALCLLKASTTL